MHSHFRSVFVLPIFEVKKNQTIPGTKAELLDLFHRKSAIWFHFELCSSCHSIPHAGEWIKASKQKKMKVLTTSRRIGAFYRWEPLFIGTNNDPIYDERLSWEGKRDKMTHAYIMCLLDYKFNILSNAFLVHKAGIKHKSIKFKAEEKVNGAIIENEIYKEIRALYKNKKSCII